MDTNPLTFQQLTNYLASNPIPVSLPNADFNSWLNLYCNAFASAAPVAVLIAVCWLIVRSFTRTQFPGSED